MKIVLEGTPKEIADLVVEIQSQPNSLETAFLIALEEQKAKYQHLV